MLGAGSYIRELELESKVASGARGRARLLMKQLEETQKAEAMVDAKLKEAAAAHYQEVSELQRKLQQGEEVCKLLEEENRMIASQAKEAANEAQRTIEELRRDHEHHLRGLQDELEKLKATLEEERSASNNAHLQHQLQHQKEIEDLKMVHLKELESKAASTEAEVKKSFSAGVWSQLEFYLPQFQQGFDWPAFKAFLDQQMEEDDALEQRLREEEEAAAGGHPETDAPK